MAADVISGKDVSADVRAAVKAAAETLRREFQAEVQTVVGDITTEAGRAEALQACPDPEAPSRTPNQCPHQK